MLLALILSSVMLIYQDHCRVIVFSALNGACRRGLLGLVRC